MRKVFGVSLIGLSVIMGAVMILFVLSGGLEEQFGPQLVGIAAEPVNHTPINPVTVSSEPRIEPREVAVYVEPLRVPVDISYANTVRDAMRLWEQKQPVTFNEVDDELDADLRVFWVKDFGSEKLGHARGTDLIEVGLGDGNCLGDWQTYSYSTVVYIAAHEIGHALGLDHVDDETNVMHPILPTRYHIDAQVSEFLPDDVIKYYPVCTGEASAKYTITLKSDSPLSVYALENEDQENFIAAYEPFSHFEDCAIIEQTDAQRTCILPAGAEFAVLQPPGATGSTQFSFTIQEAIS